MVDSEATCSLHPGVRPFHDPALGEHDEAISIGLYGESVLLTRGRPASDVRVCGMAHDVYLDVMALREGLCAATGVTGIDEYGFH